MARVTRSKKIEIQEDNTAIAIQTPLPETSAKAPFAELPKESNTMPSMEEDAGNMDMELKGLKAAYRAALGVGKKGKKLKIKRQNKKKLSDEAIDSNVQSILEDETSLDTAPAKNKKGNRELEQEEDDLSVQPLNDGQTRPPKDNRHFSEEVIEHNANPITRATRQRGVKAQASLPNLSNITETNDKFPARVTRQQASKAQAGQSDLSTQVSRQSSSMRLRDNFILSLFAGRTAGSPRVTGHNSNLARNSTNNLFLSAGKATEMEASLTIDSVASLQVQDNTLAKNDILVAQIHDLPEIQTDSESPVQSTWLETGSRSPLKSKVKTLEEVESAFIEREPVAPTSDPDDSFVEQIICRSPAKPVSRIEDSVEALDQLEEALEAIDQAALAERIVSPIDRHINNTMADRTKPDAVRQKSVSHQRNPKATTMRVKSTAPRAPVIKRSTSAIFKSTSQAGEEQNKVQEPKKAPIKRPVSLLPPKEPVRSVKPPTFPTKFELPGEAVARKLKEQREARQAQRESNEDHDGTRSISGLKVKLGKPPTKPAFELPGEAISRRKREAHEAHLKAQEEEERARREFKAKPMRTSVVPSVVPRDTIASRARQSKIGLDSIESGNLNVDKRGSNIGAHRPSFAHLALANTSAPRSHGTGIERKASTKAATLSMTGLATQRSVSSTDVQAQRQRAKEIYNRDIKLAEDLEREKREREAAAKRSREEAAERGRQASREWAEKMRARKAAEGDKGMGMGYRPGGQMGLRG